MTIDPGRITRAFRRIIAVDRDQGGVKDPCRRTVFGVRVADDYLALSSHWWTFGRPFERNPNLDRWLASPNELDPLHTFYGSA
jgi:hypothetical protein